MPKKAPGFPARCSDLFLKLEPPINTDRPESNPWPYH
jgi:hypothetical protein